MGWTIAIVAVVVFVVVTVIRQARKMTLLVHRGELIEGTLVEKFRNQKGHPVFRYEYSTPDGARHQGICSVTRGEWDAYEEGDPFEVVYAPSHPSLSDSRRMINLGRESLKLPPL